MLNRQRSARNPLEWSAERQARFWAKVERGADDQCWRWLGRGSANGFGRFGIRVNRKRTIDVYAHRAAWVLTYGRAVPAGGEVFHAVCGDRLCVNPYHLQLGVAQDRLAAASARGTLPAGERHHAAKLTMRQVEELRRRKAADERVSASQLAEEVGISRTRMEAILRGDGWQTRER